MRTAVPPSILRLDITGQPVAWMNWQDTVCLYVKDLIAWEVGNSVFPILGGRSRLTGERSRIVINSIVAARGLSRWDRRHAAIPALSNRELFRRDGHMCMYCGETYQESLLTRDHIVPRSKGGQDQWTNVVSACRRCNTAKGSRTPEEAQLALLAVPFAPNRAEYLALKNRRILADQMDFLKKQFSHKRLMDL